MEDILNEQDKEFMAAAEEDLNKINKDYLNYLKENNLENNEDNRIAFVQYLNDNVIHVCYEGLIELSKEDELEDLEDLQICLSTTFFFRSAIVHLTKLLIYKRNLYDLLVEKYRFIPYLIDRYISENYNLVDSLLNISSSLNEEDEEDFDENEVEEE